MTGINEVAKEIHENARAHGWWDEERGFPEVLALIHKYTCTATVQARSLQSVTRRVPWKSAAWAATAAATSPCLSMLRTAVREPSALLPWLKASLRLPLARGRNGHV